MLKIGSLVDGKYRVLSEIGRGGMSVVYMAINEKANKTWAIKEVRKDGVKDFEVVRQGLIVETELLKRLSHPNLPSIVDVIENEDTLLIVMDYIEGNPLSKALEEYGAQPQEYVIEWAKQLCDVLEYLHTRTPSIVYRDMKPANVMLKPDGNVTLIDFGTAREYKEKNLADTTCLGTVGYAAPEQFGGMGQTDARTDIYCLGATLYHLVTGCNPCEPPYEILPIRSINPQLSSGLERIIIKCTQRNPEDRYQSCAELMYALDHYEEIDDIYRNAQKKKFIKFASCAVLSLAFLAGGITCGVLESRETEQLYSSHVAKAERETVSEAKRKCLYDALQTKYEDKSGAIKMLMDIYRNDGILSAVQTEAEMQTVVKEKNDKGQKDETLKSEFTDLTNLKHEISQLEPSKAADLYYFGGRIIYSLYSEDGKTSGDFAGGLSAESWFEEAIKSAESIEDESVKFDIYNDKGAKILRNICKYQREIIAQGKLQGSDSSTIEDDFDGNKENPYQGFWTTWNEYMNDENFKEESSSGKSLDFAAYNLYISGANFFRQNATKFKHNVDGIKKDQMLEICSEMEKRAIAICKKDTTKNVEEAIETTKKIFERTYENIRRAFDTEY